MGRLALLGLVRWPGAVTAAGNAATCFLLAHDPASRGGLAAALGAVGGGALLYSGGVVLNDVADAERDRTLHPERPIPAGRVAPRPAAWFGASLLGAGVALVALLAGVDVAVLAAVAALAAVLYDFVLRDVRIAGVAFLGLARAANAAMGGAAAVGLAAYLAPGDVRPLAQFHPVALFAYTALLTWISTFEDERTSRTAPPLLALGLCVVAAAPWMLFETRGWPESPGIPLLLLAGALAIAARDATAEDGPGLGAVVRAGVFGFVLVDAFWLFGARRYAPGFYAILVYVVLRLVLRRRRS